jgi:carboxylesterase
VTDILQGAEPQSWPGGPNGVLVLHGLTGCPQSMRPLAAAFAAAGFATELPLLPGHGTSLDDMKATGWADWSATAEQAYDELAARCDRVVVAGLSMGGTLTAWLGAERPDVAGLVFVNPAIEPAGDNMRDILRQMLGQGIEIAPPVGNDVAKPGITELAYDGIPVASVLTMIDAQRELAARLADVRCPSLVMTSRQDHVVAPGNSDYLAERLGGPVERVWLERSYHVATIDHDAEEIQARAVDFARKVTA